MYSQNHTGTSSRELSSTIEYLGSICEKELGKTPVLDELIRCARVIAEALEDLNGEVSSCEIQKKLKQQLLATVCFVLDLAQQNVIDDISKKI